MIFLTVGSQMPFDRLVSAVDRWADHAGRSDVFAQIGDSLLKPKAIEYTKSLSPAQFTDRVASAELVVAHAGMGSILTALVYAKPLVLLARRGDLLETRNDHQLSTAKWLGRRSGIFVADSDKEIGECIEAGLREAGPVRPIDDHASDELIERIAEFIVES